MLSAFSLAFRQLGDPAVLRVLGKSLLLTLLIVPAAFSLAATGKTDYAWAGFNKAFREGTIVNPKKK